MQKCSRKNVTKRKRFLTFLMSDSPEQQLTLQPKYNLKDMYKNNENEILVWLVLHM